jgi:hypothetical protein
MKSLCESAVRSCRRSSAIAGYTFTYHRRVAWISVAVVLILISGSVRGEAATLEEVARCRSMQVTKERLDCFNSLKAIDARGPRANDGTSNENDKGTQPPQEVPKAGSGSPNDVRKTDKGRQPAKQIGDKPKTSEDPPSTGSIGHLGVASGQPVCVDRDSLAASIIAGVLASSSDTVMPTNGCAAIPQDADIEILERYPSGFGFLRVVKVKITNHSTSDSTIGYTVEVSR